MILRHKAVLAALPLAAGVFFTLSAAGLTGASLAPKTAFAGENPAGGDCVITQSDLDSITAAANAGLAAELAARKALLTRTISCAKEDALALQNNVNDVQVTSDAIALRDQLAGRIQDALNYYDLELAKVNDSGLAGTKSIAREVGAWRAGYYATVAGQANNFMLWEKNQALFKTADTRLAQMKGIVNFLEQAGANIDLENALGSAEGLVETAQSENESARNAMLQSLSPDASLPLIKQSLQSLSDAYDKFFSVSTMIQDLLAAKTE